MSDTIWLRGISGVGRHGVHDFERADGQPFLADIGIAVDTRPASRTDDLVHTVSYAELAEQVHEVLTGPPVALLETLAERLAEVALSFPGVRRADVVVHKPQAPIAVPFDDVTVSISRTPLTLSPAVPVPCVLGLGANLSDPRATLRAAVAELADALGPLQVGPLVRTAAMTLPGSEPQPDYWNTVVLAHTRLAAAEVLGLARRLEAAHGRTRDVRWGARTLDVDILACGTIASAEEELLLPHPGAASRPFVVVPWAALQPGVELGGVTLAELARRLEGEILARREDWR